MPSKRVVARDLALIWAGGLLALAAVLLLAVTYGS
jgi:hypothetical protein